MLAEVAISTQDWAKAEVAIAQGLAVLEGVEAPLAEWRARVTAAQLYKQLGRTAESVRLWQRSAGVLRRLADSLSEGGLSCESLLAHPTTLSILQHASWLDTPSE